MTTQPAIQAQSITQLEPEATETPAIIAVNPLDLPSDLFQSGLERCKHNRTALMHWIRDALVEGSDYGRIHIVGRNRCQAGNQCKNPQHFSKPSLFKPGAEKICGMLGVTVRYPTLPDYEQAALSGVDLKHIILRCEIIDVAGRVVADGIGARLLVQDNGDLNKALKMAEKSGHIDATLRMAGLSEVFTQDVEDMGIGSVQKEKRQSIGITEQQHRRLEARITQLGLDRERVKQWLIKSTQGTVTSFLQLTPKLYERLYTRLEQFAGGAS